MFYDFGSMEKLSKEEIMRRKAARKAQAKKMEKSRRANRRKNGLCADCPRPIQNSKTYCEEHRKQHADYATARARKLAGIPADWPKGKRYNAHGMARTHATFMARLKVGTFEKLAAEAERRFLPDVGALIDELAELFPKQ